MASLLQRRNHDLAPTDGVSDAERLRRQIDALFERALDPSAPLTDLVVPLVDVFVPPADVEETDDSYVVEIELPGVDKDDIDVTVSGRRLVVTGERKEKERVGLIRRRTRRIGEFRYELVLPEDLDEDGVTASLEGGLLTVTVAKAAPQRRRRIDVDQPS